MHEAVFGCLVAKGVARYSAYLSYRAASEAPLARLLFDALNHRSVPSASRLVACTPALFWKHAQEQVSGVKFGRLKTLLTRRSPHRSTAQSPGSTA
jgi:hypothetical protein